MIPIKFCPSTRSQTYRKIEIESRFKIYDGMKVRSKEVFRIKKRDKNFPRRAEAHLKTSYAREIRILLSSYKKGEGFKDFARRKKKGKIEIAKRWRWLLDVSGWQFFFFFFCHLRGAKLSLNATTLREREVRFLPLSLLCEQWKAEMHFLNGTNVLFGSFVHSFIHSSLDRSVLTLFVPWTFFFFLSFFICTPLESWSKGDIFLERLQLTRIGEWKV